MIRPAGVLGSMKAKARQAVAKESKGKATTKCVSAHNTLLHLSICMYVHMLAVAC